MSDRVNHGHTHARVRIVGGGREPIQCVGQTIDQQADELHRRRAHERIWRTGKAGNPLGPGRTRRRQNPGSLEMGLIETGTARGLRVHPRLDGGHRGRPEFTQLNPRVVADDVLRMKEER